MTTSLLLLSLPALLAYAAASDLLTMTIPNVLVMALAAFFLVGAAALGIGWTPLLLNILAFSVVLVVSFGLFGLGWIGGGDAKLAAATALWLGFDGLPSYLLISSALGGVLTLAILGMRTLPLPAFTLGWPWLLRLHDQRTGIPYGIALAAGGLLVYPQSQIYAAWIAR